MFIEQVEEQLRKMSEADKDRWILAQAKLLDESERQGFLLALSGQKKITYMPDDSEIQAFLEKVRSMWSMRLTIMNLTMTAGLWMTGCHGTMIPVGPWIFWTRFSEAVMTCCS